MIHLLLAASVAAATLPVVTAERTFAQTAKEKGIAAAFRIFVADDGVIFTPDPTPGKPLLQRQPDRPGSLEWWPVYAGVAASGDLGFTTGPYVSVNSRGKGQGQYFTIWRKQDDGSWRWVLDHGPQTDEVSPLTRDAPLRLLPKVKDRAAHRGTWEGVERAEAELAAKLNSDAKSAYLAAFGEEARLMRQGPQPAIGRAAVAAMLDTQPARMEARTLGGAVSKAGDLAYTYGNVRWQTEAGPQRGHYVRIWQNRKRGWTLAVDSVVPVQER